jgi:hypothetical protein
VNVAKAEKNIKITYAEKKLIFIGAKGVNEWIT